jgi:hypothetical protein
VNDTPLTTSAVVSFSQELEQRLAMFYEELEQRFHEHHALLREFALSCIKTGAQVVRTYQETVSDALETGYSFAGISLKAYQFDLDLPEGLSWDEALARAKACESTAATFYSDAAAASESLLATIPRAFRRAARTHQQRRAALDRLT